ncbi:MAG TPA: DUF3052 family protein [Anaerolineae bacterium]|nr:DUF3052 family protein [Anaerolineae bacterium]
MAGKLQIKPGTQLAVLSAPAELVALLAAELPGIDVGEGVGRDTDSVLLCVRTHDEVDRLLGGAIASVTGGGLLWVAYPKASSGVKTDLNRDRLWEAVLPSGWRPVRQVALSEAWSAIRLRPADMVGK